MHHELANQFMLPSAYREPIAKLCGRLGVSKMTYHYWRSNPVMSKYVKELRKIYFNDSVPDILLSLKHSALAGDTQASKVFLDEIRVLEDVEEIRRGRLITKEGVVQIWEEITNKKI